MASDKEKVMIYRDGPEGGGKMEWKGQGTPPPASLCIVDDDTYGVYKRSNIKPGKQKIEYHYEFKGKVPREEAEKNYIQGRSERQRGY